MNIGLNCVMSCISANYMINYVLTLLSLRLGEVKYCGNSE